MPTDDAIETFELTKAYRNIHALKALNLRVQPNSICGFLGPNGAGMIKLVEPSRRMARPE